MIHSSLFWQDHFRKNLTANRVDWKIQPTISPLEKKEIIYSLKAWQLGETSDGSHLLKAAEKYAKKIDDPDYPNAVRLFIKEEQKHGRNLGKYIDLIDEQRCKSDWGDTLFRRIRYFNTSMELWTVAVIIVESAAQIFYLALKDSTKCKLLKSICQDILIDEAHHIKFQNERLYQIFEKKSFYNKAFSIGWYGILFFGTIHAIWFGHKKAFKAGSINKKEFMRLMYYKFFKSMKYCHSQFSLTSPKFAHA
ncbi:ferritin-like domain-containing protein [Ekhidna sp.]|uniref:ferritin-like domain-containing protein n=1 Tax=Ekhidna sp. TaxID=2608089 RepID=UPI003299FC61